MYYEKAVLKSLKNVTEKKRLYEPLFKLSCRPTAWTFFFLKKAPVHVLNIKFCQNQPQNVSIDRFFRFTSNIFRPNTSLFWKSLATSYDWTDLSLIKQVIYSKCYRKSKVVAQKCSVKMIICFTEKHLWRSPFWKISKPTCLQLH